MARKKEVSYINGALKGAYLDETTVGRLDRILQLQEQNGVIPDIKNAIHDLDDDTIDTIIAQKSNEGCELTQGSLKDGQTLAVGFMFYSRRMILGDSVGLGKSVEISALLNLLDVFYAKQGIDHKYIVLTETNLLNQFHRELIRFTGEYVPQTRATKGEIQDFLTEYGEDMPSFISTHSLFTQAIFNEKVGEMRENGGFPYHTLIVDESSVLSSTTTQRYKDAMILAGGMENIIILNATVFESNLMNFYSQLHFIDDTYLPTKTVFQKTYCVTARSVYGNYQKPTGKYKNAKGFKDLVRYRYFKRTRRDEGAKYEDNIGFRVLLEKTAEQKFMLPRTSMPQMVFDDPTAFDDTIEFNAENVPKAGEVVKLLTTGGGRPGEWRQAPTVLIYCHYVGTQEKLSKLLDLYGITNAILNGNTSQEDRLSRVKGFQHGEYRVLITNVMKGLNFGHCNHTIIYTVPGNINNLVQFEGRYTREFDVVGKRLAMLVMEGQEEQRISNMLGDRARASNQFSGNDYSLVLELLTGDEY